jgi:hypothetical protein
VSSHLSPNPSWSKNNHQYNEHNDEVDGVTFNAKRDDFHVILPSRTYTLVQDRCIRALAKSLDESVWFHPSGLARKYGTCATER